MAIIYTYPIKATPVDGDLVLISDSADSNNTKQVKVSSIRGATVAGVSQVTAGGVIPASSGAPLLVSPTSGNVVVTSARYVGGSNEGHVPLGGTASTFLRGDGTWVSVVSKVSDIAAGTSGGKAIVVNPLVGDVEIQPMAFAGDSNVGHVPDASGAAGTAYLKNDGSWSTPPDTDTTYTMSAATDGLNVDLTLDASTGTDTTIQLTAGANMTLTRNSATEVTFASSAAGDANGWDIINFAQGEAMSDNAAIVYFYQVVVPESFTANKAKIYVNVAGGSSTFAVAVYDGILSNLAGTTLLGSGSSNPSGPTLLEISLSPVGAGDLNLTKGQNVIMAFSQTLGDKILSLSSRYSDANISISSVFALPFPSDLSAITPSTSELRPCCVLYQ